MDTSMSLQTHLPQTARDVALQSADALRASAKSVCESMASCCVAMTLKPLEPPQHPTAQAAIEAARKNTAKDVLDNLYRERRRAYGPDRQYMDLDIARLVAYGFANAHMATLYLAQRTNPDLTTRDLARVILSKQPVTVESLLAIDS